MIYEVVMKWEIERRERNIYFGPSSLSITHKHSYLPIFTSDNDLYNSPFLCLHPILPPSSPFHRAAQKKQRKDMTE
jgi:hypothetical protein